MPYEVREIQSTPNPNAAKFVLDRPVSDSPTSFFNAEQAKGHLLATRLFAIEGVTSLLLLGDFITVNKTPDTHWKVLSKQVSEILRSWA